MNVRNEDRRNLENQMFGMIGDQLEKEETRKL